MPCPTRWKKWSPKPAVGNDGSGRCVDVLALGPDRRGSDPRLLRLDQHGVDIGDLGRRLADMKHPRDVGAIARHRPAEIAQDEITRVDAPLRRWLVVRARRVRAGRDNGEVRTLVPVRQHPLDKLAMHVELGPAGEPDRSRISAATASTACAARVSASISSASLTIRIGLTTSVARENTHDGTACCRSSTNRAHVWSPIATRRAERRTIPATSCDRVVGLVPRDHGEELRVDARPAAPRAGERRAGCRRSAAAPASSAVRAASPRNP